MPDDNGNLIQGDLLNALETAELAIARFEPPSATPATSSNPDAPPATPDLQQIMREVARVSAEQRTQALFGFIQQAIQQGVDSVLGERLTAVNEQLASIQTQLDALNARLGAAGL